MGTLVSPALISSSVQDRAPVASSTVSDCTLFAALVAVCRFAFRSHFLYDIDSVNFALALGIFDPAVHQPHPPGYFFYVLLGRLVNALTADANTAFVLISIAASCGAVVMIYLLAESWFGRGAAVLSALLFLFSPLAWFHGTVALTYVVECFFSALIGYLGWRLKQGSNCAVALCATLGIAAGFRPSSLLLLGPLCAYAILVSRPRHLFLTGATLSATLLSWFVPMVEMTGGFHRYLQSFSDLWTVAGGKNTVLTSSLAFSFARLLMIAAVGCLCYGAAVAFAFTNQGQRSREDRERARFTGFWIGPGLLFFTFVFLRFVNSGYLLFLSPPLFAYLGRNIFNWFTAGSLSRSWRAGVLLAAGAANTAIFLFAPIYCSYRSVRQFEAQLVSFNAAVRRAASPEGTLLVGFDSHFLGYRHAAYYLPEYLTVQFPEMIVGGKHGAFGVQNRRTEFLAALPRDRFERFILLPLPPDDEDRAYLRGVYSRFPPEHLETSQEGGWSLVAGPIGDLKYLFAHL